jgi:transcriptional regulator with XRE-family HTH domain
VVRVPLSSFERERGAALGTLLRDARGDRSVRDVAACAGLAEETVRKIERGAVPTPSLFAVAALAKTLDLELDGLVRACHLRTAPA